MDPKLTEAVMEAFVRLHDQGYIYRANHLVNWSVKLNTTISNLEVVSQELAGRAILEVPGYERKVEFGVMTYFKYPIENSSETIEIATTRPETMLGDTAVAVHPDDPRYKNLVGKSVRHPLLDRVFPIIADAYVERDFGTGAVKITPAHDANDFAIGVRHSLPFINILNDGGTMNQNAGKFQGQKRYDVRYAVVEELTNLNLFVRKESNPMTIRRCDKSKDIVEPLLKPQWWMRMDDLAAPAIAAVKSGEIKTRPESAEKSYFRWLDNINDWCLSRQLRWGQQYLLIASNLKMRAHRKILKSVGWLREMRPKLDRKLCSNSLEKISACLMIPTFWTLGSRLAYGRSRLWDGRIVLTIFSTSFLPLFLKRMYFPSPGSGLEKFRWLIVPIRGWDMYVFLNLTRSPLQAACEGWPVHHFPLLTHLQLTSSACLSYKILTTS